MTQANERMSDAALGLILSIFATDIPTISPHMHHMWLRLNIDNIATYSSVKNACAILGYIGTLLGGCWAARQARPSGDDASRLLAALETAARA